MDSETIENLRKVYNAEHPNETPLSPGSPESVWKSLQTRLHAQCKSGRTECVVSHLLSQSAAPSSWQMNPEEWLSSIDIENVEKQQMKLFPAYKFLGCIPIDFDLHTKTGKCLVDALCAIRIADLQKAGHHQIGIVFNTDVHTGPGQHWVGLFCDIRPELEEPRVTYFDSYSKKPEKEIQRLMKRWRDQWAEAGVHSKPMATTYNTTRHQFKDSECGMYCLQFHQACLVGIPMEESIPDDVVNTFRRLLFRVSKK